MFKNMDFVQTIGKTSLIKIIMVIFQREILKNLDVLVLEINPSPKDKDDEDVIKTYLKKWFEEMKVNKFELYNSDLPQYTKTRIDKFITNG